MARARRTRHRCLVSEDLVIDVPDRSHIVHRWAAGLVGFGLVLALLRVGIPAYRRSGSSGANVVATVSAVACAVFVARALTSSSLERALRRRWSTDIAAALLLLLIALPLWWAVKHQIGR
jgi:hypothetical protein